MTWSSVSFSLLDTFWLFLALCFLVAFCVHKASAQLPGLYRKSSLFTLFQDLIRYGKTKQKLNRAEWLRVFDVPKRWFWHFYAISVFWNVFLLLLSINFIYQLQSYPSWLTGMLKILTGVPSFDGQAPQLATVLVQLLLCVHSLRRLLECLFVSVFSDGVMHLVQYLFGLGYYMVLGLTVLCSDQMAKGPGTLLSQLDWIHVAGFVLFIAASLLQHQSTVLLARLRKGKSGRVETLAHRVPEGGWFDLVSCPHYFAELLIYISLGFVLGGLSLTWWLVVLYVLFSQALAGQLCHDLYISKYELYPKHRRAFIPFVL
ncbi:polyprenol reductase [Girardinichthys multiradiatus]|uniref:polyprenol reductase n=1 Tax=Girardinichthys multiradiatus TaxID=208333 RepID=UPI001FAD2197|nr:polyprenol reductase [Girardinichthys multiradiatus]